MEWKGDGNFSLERISTILDLLGNPQDRVRAVHVAGTNGKGSVSAAIASILGADGYRVGLNISPHLYKINERIIVDGFEIEDQPLAYYALWLKQVCQMLNVRPTLHEGITAIAFLAFADLKLDWMVIEVGLGGRLDSSNVMKRPEVSCIASIGLDHEHILGSTHAQIAAEKAGIAKRDGRVVIGPMSQEARSAIVSACQKVSATLYEFGRDFEASVFEDGGLYVSEGYGSFPFCPALGGQHQIENMAVAIQAARILNVSPEACQHGVEQVYWPARLESIVYGNKRLIFDCAHNEPGVRALLNYLEQNGLKGLQVGFGVLDTKNWQQMIALLEPYCSDWNLLAPISARAVPSERISEYLSGFGISARSFGEDYTAFIREVLDEPGPDTVLITGSMYMLGLLRKMLVNRRDCYWKRAIKINQLSRI